MSSVLVKMGRAYLMTMRILLSVMAAAMLFIICWAVFSRSFLNSSVVWADTIASWTMVWLVFFGSALAVFRGGHMEVGAGRDALPRNMQKIAVLIGHLGVIAAGAFLAYAGLLIVETQGATPSPATGLETKWALWAFPVGSVLIVLHAVERFITALRTSPGSSTAETEKERNAKEGA